MAEQIYQKTFYTYINKCYEDKNDAREYALKKANEFFINHDSFSVINIIENWNEHGDCLYMIVYYKSYI